ncbi:hypothetical protein N9L68_07830 [bacterium]|nr:hypothetical protein [bacterium]
MSPRARLRTPRAEWGLQAPSSGTTAVRLVDDDQDAAWARHTISPSQISQHKSDAEHLPVCEFEPRVGGDRAILVDCDDRQRPSATIGNGHRQRPSSATIGNGHRQRSAAVIGNDRQRGSAAAIGNDHGAPRGC